MHHVHIYVVVFIKTYCCLSTLTVWRVKYNCGNICKKITEFNKSPCFICGSEERVALTLLTHNAFLRCWGDDVAYVQVL